MSKALVIKGANFSANKLTTIVISDPVPCTGISLNKSAETLMSIGATSTLIATAQPADTTDIVSWMSSNPNVATVNDGVITSVGVGTATITAVCGSYSASCIVTSRAFMNVNVAKTVGSYPDGAGAASGGNGLTSINATVRGGGLFCTEGLLHMHGSAGANLYPYIFAPNTKHIKITVKSGNVSNVYKVLWYNHAKAASGYSSECEVITVNTSPTLTDGVCVVDVPIVDGYTIDSFALGVRVASSDTLVESDLDGLEVEFLPAENIGG